MPSATRADRKPDGAARITGLTAGVAGLFLLLRLLAVSAWDWETASEVLETINVDDSISILFGTLFAVPVVAGILVSVLLPLAAFDLIRLRARSGSVLGQMLLVVVLVVTAIALLKTFGYLWLPAATLIVFGLIAVHERVRRTPGERDILLIVVKRVGAMALVALLVLAAAVRTPWTPEEKITTKSGVMTGYVLSAEPGFLKVLTADTRELVIVPSGDVGSRTPLH